MSDTKIIEVYLAKDGWRWTKIASSDTVADSGQAYIDKSGAEEAAAKEAEGTDFMIRVREPEPEAE